MAECKKCGKAIPDGQEYCEDCQMDIDFENLSTEDFDIDDIDLNDFDGVELDASDIEEGEEDDFLASLFDGEMPVVEEGADEIDTSDFGIETADEDNNDDLFDILNIEDEGSKDILNQVLKEDTEEEKKEEIKTTSTKSMDDIYADSLGSISSLEDDVDLDALLGEIPEKSSEETEGKPKKKKKEKKPKEPKERKSVHTILFGEDDEEDKLIEEKLAKKKEEKKEKKAKKKEVNAEKKEQKKAQKEQKKSEKEQKKREKKEKQAANAEPDDSQPIKKIPVIITVVFLAVLGTVVILGTNVFSYKLAISNAKDYFKRGKYSMAYDQIAGKEVKKKDKKIKDQIYVVMYVEKKYESYEAYMGMNKPVQALNALVKGIEKYNVHAEEAKKLGVEKDLNSSKDKLCKVLKETFQLSEKDANQLLTLEPEEYNKRLIEIVQKMED